jgi:hypothetical protein
MKQRRTTHFLTRRRSWRLFPHWQGISPTATIPYIFALIELSEYPQSENSIAKKLFAGTIFWVYQTRITLLY